MKSQENESNEFLSDSSKEEESFDLTKQQKGNEKVKYD